MKVRKNSRWQEMDKSSMELSRLIQFYETFNRSEGKSYRTVDWYTEVLNLFLDWLKLKEKPTNLGYIGEMEVREFILSLREKKWRGKPLSSQTLNNRVRALRAFFSWLAREDYTEDNLLAKLKPPKITEPIIEPLTIEEVERLFSKISQNTVLGARNAAILALLLDTGLRLLELITLKVQDVHLDQRYIKVLGKGAKERIVPLGASCHKTMLRYYYHFRVETAHAGVDAFFLTLDGYPLTDKAVKSLMTRLAKTAGVPRLHPHLLRHTYATSFLLNGGDVFLLKQNLGHSTLAMVERYRHIASRQAAVLSQTFSPLDRMNLRELRRHRNNHKDESMNIYPNAGQKRGLVRYLGGNHDDPAGTKSGGAQVSVSPRLRSGA